MRWMGSGVETAPGRAEIPIALHSLCISRTVAQMVYECTVSRTGLVSSTRLILPAPNYMRIPIKRLRAAPEDVAYADSALRQDHSERLSLARRERLKERRASEAGSDSRPRAAARIGRLAAGELVAAHAPHTAAVTAATATSPPTPLQVSPPPGRDTTIAGRDHQSGNEIIPILLGIGIISDLS
ncbi:hypothetical protein J6590_030631 [Homalodisca vitripennis]|nr:hypothetical protein J6590_030631 [Homalodisca vitripennis]